MALVLSQIGWQVTVLEGGYKTLPGLCTQPNRTLAKTADLPVLCGLTGSGKTHILRQLAARGVQVLDLESLANHRGSLLVKSGRASFHLNPHKKALNRCYCNSYNALMPVSQCGWKQKATKLDRFIYPHPCGNK
jgi:tRNA 2-selenouridine synthase